MHHAEARPNITASHSTFLREKPGRTFRTPGWPESGRSGSSESRGPHPRAASGCPHGVPATQELKHRAHGQRRAPRLEERVRGRSRSSRRRLRDRARRPHALASRRRFLRPSLVRPAELRGSEPATPRGLGLASACGWAICAGARRQVNGHLFPHRAAHARVQGGLEDLALVHTCLGRPAGHRSSPQRHHDPVGYVLGYAARGGGSLRLRPKTYCSPHLRLGAPRHAAGRPARPAAPAPVQP